MKQPVFGWRPSGASCISLHDAAMGNKSVPHDFENIRRGAVLRNAGKTRVTVHLDNEVLAHFRSLATQKGCGFQAEINAALRSMASLPPPVGGVTMPP